jgi:hypothetical protein
MLPALDNFVSYGTDMLTQNPTYLAAIVSMVEDIFHDEKVGGVDRVCGCKLAEAVMLNLRGFADQYVPVFIELAMNAINSGEVKTKSYRIHLMEMVINAIYYNPLLSLRVLESKGWTNKFFSAWFSNIDNFRRVHDKKLSIAAISSLLTLKAEDVPESVQQGWPRLLQGVTRLFQTLPAAVKSKWFLCIYLDTRKHDTDANQIERNLPRNPISHTRKKLRMSTKKMTGAEKLNGLGTKTQRALATEMSMTKAVLILISSTKRYVYPIFTFSRVKYRFPC